MPEPRSRHHLVSVGVGVISLLIAAVGPLELAPISPMAYCLMGPAHWAYGVRAGRRRAVLEQELLNGTAPAEVPSAGSEDPALQPPGS